MNYTSKEFSQRIAEVGFKGDGKIVLLFDKKSDGFPFPTYNHKSIGNYISREQSER